MSLSIHLLGRPRVERDGLPARQPRGRKAWALLAFLLLGGGPLPRTRLAELLFDDADDPLGALRWNLAELRRVLGPEVEIRGDPVVLDLPPGTFVDVRTLTDATWLEASAVPGIGLELLAGVDLPGSGAFESWLLAERQRIAHLAGAVLREAAAAHLAAGRTEAAVADANRLVALDEYDEGAHALMVRALRAAHGADRAREYLDAAVVRLQRDLGIDPGADLLTAADLPVVSPSPATALQGARAVESLLGAGEAAIGAGVFDAGIEILVRAVAGARELGDRHLEARVQAALGTAFVHSGRGLDARGAAALHAALALAESLGDRELLATAARELGYADMKHGRYERSEAWLGHAIEASPSEAGRAAALAIRGVVASDRGRTAQAIEWLRGAADVAAGVDKPRQAAWALAFAGRTHLLREELVESRDALDRSLETARAAGWMTFLPFPLSLRAEVDAIAGDPAAAMGGFESAFALGCQIGDPCWEGLGARGIGLAHAAAGRIEEAVRWLDDARTRCLRVSDAYLWMHAHCLDALCAIGVAHRVAGADAWVTDLESVAARTGMRELLARAYLHRARLGQPGSLDAARVFVETLDNPVVHRLLRDAASPLAVA